MPYCVGSFAKVIFNERKNAGAVYLFDPEKDAPILVSAAPRCLCQPLAVLHAPAAPGLLSQAFFTACFVRAALTGTGGVATIGHWNLTVT